MTDQAVAARNSSQPAGSAMLYSGSTVTLRTGLTPEDENIPPSPGLYQSTVSKLTALTPSIERTRRSAASAVTPPSRTCS